MPPPPHLRKCRGPLSKMEPCRICFDPDAAPPQRLIRPCKCRAPVHQLCLENWINFSKRGLTCEVCRQSFSVQVVPFTECAPKLMWDAWFAFKMLCACFCSAHLFWWLVDIACIQIAGFGVGDDHYLLLTLKVWLLLEFVCKGFMVGRIVLELPRTDRLMMLVAVVGALPVACIATVAPFIFDVWNGFKFARNHVQQARYRVADRRRHT